MSKTPWKPVGTVYAPDRKPEPDYSWIGGAFVIFLVICALAQCSH